MRALFFDGTDLAETGIKKPPTGRGESVVSVRLAGICSTDLEIMRGYMNFRGIPGHEFIGTAVSDGRRVVGEINIPCRGCEVCRSGLEKHCPRRRVLGISGKNGAFAQFLSLPEANLHDVPRSVSDEEAVFTELLASACEIPERIEIGDGARVAVLGDGRIAAMVAQVLALESGSVEVMGINRYKLSRIRSIGLAARDISKRIRFRREFDLVVECTGSPSGLPLAASLVKPRGRIVLKSTYHGGSQWNPASIAVDEITIHGSRCGPFERALDLLSNGRVDVLPFLTEIFPFSRWREAFRLAKHRDSFKVLLGMEV